jgi:hypothetical protein
MPLMGLDWIGAFHLESGTVNRSLTEEPSAGARASLSEQWQDLRYRPFLVLVALGILIRVILMLSYFPAILLHSDSARYARVGGWSIYGDFWMPAGYPMFLWLLRQVSSQLWFTIWIQHLLGLGTGTFLYLSMRRLGVVRAIACIPAAIPLLSGDHLYLEHTVMADHLTIFLTAGGILAAICGLVPNLHLRSLAIASTLLGMAALTRSVGVVQLPILVLCSALWVKESFRTRCVAVSAALLPGIGVFVLYIGGFYFAHGQYLGLTDMSGWNLYARAAPFADCRKFTPPEGTAILCEERPPAKRPGPFGYVWDLECVARKRFELGPKTGRKLGEFAKRAIIHQPWEYAGWVLIDLIKYIDPAIAPRRVYDATPREVLSFGWRDGAVEDRVVNAMSHSYKGTHVRLHWQYILAFYQNLSRPSGLTLTVLFVLTLIGLVKARGANRLGITLFGLIAFGLYLVPVLTLSYSFRYGVPPETFMVASGVLGAVSLWPRLATEKEEAAKR